MARIGLLGGSFDPIHFGHIHLALSLFEKLGLDEVWFIPSLLNPLKSNGPPIDFKHRFDMVRLALKGLSKFKVLDIEEKRPPPSFTIDTVRQLKILHPDDQFFLILGDDNINGLKNWKEITQLFELAPPIFGTRLRPIDVEKHLDPSLIPLIRNGIVSIPALEISSSEIRERLKNKLYCDHLIPAGVLDYIKQNGLYC
jgi:nicotinate-nucleotide adenylyltransferase